LKRKCGMTEAESRKGSVKRKVQVVDEGEGDKKGKRRRTEPETDRWGRLEGRLERVETGLGRALEVLERVEMVLGGLTELRGRMDGLQQAVASLGDSLEAERRERTEGHGDEDGDEEDVDGTLRDGDGEDGSDGEHEDVEMVE
jgi:hypothetical protein